MEFTIYPAIGFPIVLHSAEYDYRFYFEIDAILPGAANEVARDCLLPVKIEVLWRSVVTAADGKEKTELSSDELEISGYTFPAKLRPWDMELVNARDNISRLECGASYLISDVEKRFFTYKDRDGLAVLFFKRDLSDYLNMKELNAAHMDCLTSALMAQI